MKRYFIHIDKLIQPFEYDAEMISQLLAKENEGMLKVNNLILLRSSIEPSYAHCFQVLRYNDMEAITLGYIYWGSNNKMLGYIYFKVYNKRLYDSQVNIEDIGRTLGLEISKLPNIDIAVDFNFNVIDVIYQLFKKTNLQVIILNKVRDKEDYIQEMLNLGKGSLINPYIHKGFYIKGQDSHRLELNAYNKGLEIDTVSHKEYIRDIEGMRDIYRLEIRVNANQLEKTLRALNMDAWTFLENMYDSSLQLKVWEHIFDRILRFRIEGKRECEKIIDLLYTDGTRQQTKAYSKARKIPRKRHRKCLKCTL